LEEGDQSYEVVGLLVGGHQQDLLEGEEGDHRHREEAREDLVLETAGRHMNLLAVDERSLPDEAGEDEQTILDLEEGRTVHWEAAAVVAHHDSWLAKVFLGCKVLGVQDSILAVRLPIVAEDQEEVDIGLVEEVGEKDQDHQLVRGTSYERGDLAVQMTVVSCVRDSHLQAQLQALLLVVADHGCQRGAGEVVE